MKYFRLKISIIVSIVSLFVGVFVLPVSFAEASNLGVVFEAKPLFDEVNFLPGNEVVRTIKVGNYSDSEKNVIIESINATDNGGLGEKLDLVIKENSTIIYSSTLGAFLRAGEVALSSLSSNASTIYSLAVTFNDVAENDTQKTTLNFDLCVGFEGEKTNCGDTVTGGDGSGGDGGGSVDEGGEGGEGSENGGVSSPGTGNSGGGGGGGGGGGQNITLVITNEKVVNINTSDGKAVITWDTNYLSTSQVIYGAETDHTFPFSINLTAPPYFGYPLATVEDANKTTSHSVELTGLTLGEIYRFRVVSRASPPTVSFEHKFTFKEGGEYSLSYLSYEDGVGGVDDVNNASNSGEEDNLGLIEKNENKSLVFKDPYASTVSEDAEIADEDLSRNNNIATVLFGVPDSLLGWLKYVLYFVIVIVIIYLIFSRRKKNDSSY